MTLTSKAHLSFCSRRQFKNLAAFSKITNKTWYFMRIVYWQKILMKHHTLFFSKIRKDVAKFVVCCSCDCALRVKGLLFCFRNLRWSCIYSFTVIGLPSYHISSYSIFRRMPVPQQDSYQWLPATEACYNITWALSCKYTYESHQPKFVLGFVSCGHKLGKGWPLGSRLLCLTVSLSISHWYPGSGVVLDCIDSWSLHPHLLWFCLMYSYCHF